MIGPRARVGGPTTVDASAGARLSRSAPAGAPRLATPAAGALVDGALIALLALLPLLYFWRLFLAEPADRMTIAEGDFTQEYLPLAVTAARALREGALPLWNPYSNAGQPLLADPQNALLYPPTWLALGALDGPSGDSVLAFERLVPLHFGLAAIFAYLLGRYVAGTRLGGAVTSLTFTYSGFLVSYPVQQLPILRTAVWLPLLVLLLLLAFERESTRWAVAGGLALALALLAGHPQTALFELYALGGLLLFQLARGWAGGWRTRLATLGRFGLFVAIGFGGAAAQLLPTWELAQLSTRATVGYGFVSGGFAPRELTLNLVAPRIFGGLPLYVGIAPLLLAGAALFVSRSRRRAYFAGLALFGLLLSLGGHSFLYPVLYLVAPGFDLFRNQERSVVLMSLGIAVLAGLGAAATERRLDVAARRAFRLYRRVVLLGAGLAVALGAALVYGWTSAATSGGNVGRWSEVVDWYTLFLVFLVLGVVLLWLRGTVRSGRPVLALALLGLIVLDLFTVSWQVNLQDRPPEDVYRVSEIVARVVADREPVRATDEGVLNGNHGLIYGVATIGESFALRIKRVDDLRAGLPRAHLHDLLAVRYVITREYRPEDGAIAHQERWRDITNLLVRRSEGPGRAYFPAAVAVVDSPAEALARLKAPGFDPRALAVVERAAGVEVEPWAGAGRVEAVRVGWNDLEVRVDAPTGGLLVLSEVAYPGWRAAVDGKGAPILVVDYALRGVQVPAGGRVVSMQYEPWSLRLGLAITVLTVLLALAWLLAGVRPLRRRAGP